MAEPFGVRWGKGVVSAVLWIRPMAISGARARCVLFDVDG